MRAQSLGGSPPFCVCQFIGTSGWPERLGCAYRCFRRRSARGGRVLGWLSYGTVLVRMLKPVLSVFVGFLKVPVSVFFFVVLEQGFAMSLSTPFETGLVFDPGPSQADS